MINIRPFKESDLPEIITLFRAAVHTINKKDYSPVQLHAWAPQEIDLQKWRGNLLNNITYIAEKDNRIVGFTDMTKDGYLDHLFVHPDHQGGLVALRLFKAIVQESRRLKLTKITGM